MGYSPATCGRRGMSKFVGRTQKLDALRHAAEQAHRGQVVAAMADRGQSRLGGLSGECAGDFQRSQTAISLTATSRSNWTMGARATIIEAKWPTGEIVRQIL